MEKKVSIMILFIVLLSVGVKQLREKVPSTESILCTESKIEKENLLGTESDEMSLDRCTPLPTIQFKEEANLQAKELTYRTEHALVGVDQEYYYFIENYDRIIDEAHDPELIDKFYRVDRKNEEQKEEIGENCIEAYGEWSGVYQGNAYSCETYSDGKSSIVLTKYTQGGPEEGIVLYWREIAGIIAVENYGRYIAMLYNIWTDESRTEKSTCVICYDLETERWKEIMLCNNSSASGEKYTGGIITEIGISGGYLTWVQLQVNGERYHSEAGNACVYQYSLLEDKIEKLFEVQRDVNKIWGDEQFIITTDYITDPDSTENAGRLYVKKDGQWYQHSIPYTNARTRRQTGYVERLDKNRYVFLVGQYIYVYDLNEQTYRMLDIDRINEEAAPYYSPYRAYYFGEKAICWQYNFNSQKVTLYEVDLSKK